MTLLYDLIKGNYKGLSGSSEKITFLEFIEDPSQVVDGDYYVIITGGKYPDCIIKEKLANEGFVLNELYNPNSFIQPYNNLVDLGLTLNSNDIRLDSTDFVIPENKFKYVICAIQTVETINGKLPIETINIYEDNGESDDYGTIKSMLVLDSTGTVKRYIYNSDPQEHNHIGEETGEQN